MDRFGHKLVEHLARQRTIVLLAITLTCMVLLGFIDYVTGCEISFSLFYLFPISFATWFIGSRVGVLISALSTITWYIANQLAGETFSSVITPYWNSSIRLGFFITVTLLLNKIKLLAEHEQTISRIDYLTGVHNRRSFVDIAATEIFRARRYKHPFTVAYIDLDNFKVVNDRFGHNCGDDLLRIVAGTMVNNIRMPDIVARLGGDEFTILLPETDQRSAQKVIEKVVRQLVNEMQQKQWPVTFSIGVVTFLAAPKTPDDIIAMADDLMYSIKHKGRNAVEYLVYTG